MESRKYPSSTTPTCTPQHHRLLILSNMRPFYFPWHHRPVDMIPGLADPRVHPHPPLTSTKRPSGRSRCIAMIKTMATFLWWWLAFYTQNILWGKDEFIGFFLSGIAAPFELFFCTTYTRSSREVMCPFCIGRRGYWYVEQTIFGSYY